MAISQEDLGCPFLSAEGGWTGWPLRCFPLLSLSAKIDWKLAENGIAHHTDQYSGNELVVRRGQPFAFSLTFDGAPQEARSLTFTVDTGSTDALQSRTRVAFGVSRALGGNSWAAAQTFPTPGTMTFFITSPSNAAIGRYQLYVRTSSGSSSASSVYLGTFVLLFNPWLQGDEVYMPDNIDLEEYVLSESGAVFMGSYYSISRMGWNFGQFQDGILDICLSILDHSLEYRNDPVTDLRHRNDPKYVGRVLSAMINSNDDKGVLMGNWSGNYSGGQSPSSWTGSAKILQKWKSSGFQPVRYGQCWVFAGVLTTVLRCLGFPARMITNFNSAHDTNENLRVDMFYSPDGKFLETTNDSVWNFHVWNEAWFTRSDLGAKYNGWQILDATPQELSYGIYQCGPASQVAIKEGDVDLGYDGPFIFSEVNADEVSWTLDKANQTVKKAASDIKTVGKFISTKAVGSFARHDVTDDYKYPEGTNEERETFHKARAKLNLEPTASPAMARPTPAIARPATARPAMARPVLTMPALFPDAPQPRVTGKFEVKSHLEVGQDVELVLQLTNLVPEASTLTVNMNAWTIIYTGKAIHEVWKDSLALTLGPKEEKAFPIKISYAAYQQHLTTDNMIRVTALCQVQKGSDTVVLRNISLENPTVTLKVPSHAKVGEALKVEMVFTNPLEKEISSCVLVAEGNDLLEDEIRKEVPPVKGKETVCVSFEVTPKKKGTKQLMTLFSCDKFKDVKAFELIKVVH
ncbi:LOW QUALITY PROTEIN: protein-glutamine gamma-glutamyltransferase E-like [Anolis sagrei]|uniref:LOW QUALITY PROTEIN: protein-glutamine gamma-glutamyltransferase E-like n=1 Tax=Anolis sagrei TaxID=38937 RepID=UPI00351FCE9A